MEPFSFASSSDLELPVSVRINSLDGYQTPVPYSKLLKRPDLRFRGSNLSPNSELYVTAQLWADSKPLTVPVQTPYKVFKNGRVWNEWITLPISYSSAPLSSQIAITLWDLSPTGGEGAVGHAIPFGGTTVPLFDEQNTLQKGRQRCLIHRHRAADGLSSTTTPSVRPVGRGDKQTNAMHTYSDSKEAVELQRLEELMKKHEMGEIPENKWLDQLVFRHIEKLERDVSKKVSYSAVETNGIVSGATKLPNESGTRDKMQSQSDKPNRDEDSGHWHLFIDFPRFDHPIVFADYEYPAPPISTLQSQFISSTEIQAKPQPKVTFGPGINFDGSNHDDSEAGRLIKIYDPEIGIKENPVETKHRRLMRNQRTGVLDRDLKPNAKIRDELSNIIAYGPTQELKGEEKDLVWKFRHHLTRNKHALTKFVKSVSWNDKGEAKQAVQLLPKWTEIGVDDALELLGPTFTSPHVRAYAVDRLRKADDDELLIYLLQLVQALKFEKIGLDPDNTAQESSLATLLISRATQNFMLGNFLHWYLMVECDDHSAGQSPEQHKLFARVEYDFMNSLISQPDGHEIRKTLLRQAELIMILSKISKDVRFSRETRPHKIEKLKKLLADPKNDLLSFDPPIPLPLDPSILITGVDPTNATVFKSSLSPLMIHFRTVTNPDIPMTSQPPASNIGLTYPIIFKTGDDLRQDQLVMQTILLMDRLLRKENLDLKLTPYRILATGTTAGAVQFIPSASLGAITAKHTKGSAILSYLRTHNPDSSSAGSFGVRKEALDTYVKSCAGYCVITYLLGVGDRHLDNLLLTPDGHFFHADFGYILGRDPKPFAPLMKLSKEMIEGMGGAQSPYYAEFKQHCFTAYTTLRKSSGLILNLFSLMVDANIPDIRMEPDKAVGKVKERFHLELKTEEEVMRMWEGLVEESVGALWPVVVERAHALMQFLKA